MFKSLYPITVPFGCAFLFVSIAGLLECGELVKFFAACAGIFLGWWLNRQVDISEEI